MRITESQIRKIIREELHESQFLDTRLNPTYHTTRVPTDDESYFLSRLGRHWLTSAVEDPDSVGHDLENLLFTYALDHDIAVGGAANTWASHTLDRMLKLHFFDRELARRDRAAAGEDEPEEDM